MDIFERIDKLSGMEKVGVIDTLLANENDPAEVGSIIATVIKKWADKHDENATFLARNIADSMEAVERELSFLTTLLGREED